MFEKIINEITDIFVPEIKIFEILNNEKLTNEQKVREFAKLGIKISVIASLLGVSVDFVEKILEKD